MLDFDKPKGKRTWSCREYFLAEGTLAYTLGFGTTNKAAMFELYDRMAKSFEILQESFLSRSAHALACAALLPGLVMAGAKL